MFELRLFIPLHDNQSKEFSELHHEQFEREILDRFEGVSLLPGTVEGQWKDQGQIYHDSLRVYSIALESITQGSLIGELAEIARAHYQQEAVFVRYLEQAEIL